MNQTIAHSFIHSLQFEPGSENEFQAEYAEKFTGLTRLALLFSSITMALFGPLDMWSALDEVVLHQLWAIRYLIICPAFLFGLAWTFHSTYRRWMQSGVSLVVMIAGLASAIMVALARREDAAFNTYYVGMILITLGIYTFIRLRFWYALTSSLIIMASYEIAALFFQDLLNVPMGSSTFITANFFFVAANFVGAFASYNLELYTRRDFLQRKTIEAERAKAEDSLKEEAAETLRKSEAHYRSLIENASDGVGIMSQDGVFQYLSPSFEKIWGWESEEIVGQSLSSLIHPDDLARTRATFANIIAYPDKVVTNEARVRHKDGSWVVVERLGFLREDGMVIINVRNITKRKLVEDKLRESEEYYRSLIEISADGIAIIDGSGVFEYVSPSYKQNLGYEPEELEGQPFGPLVHPDDLQSVLQTFAEFYEHPELPIAIEYRVRHKDGNWHFAESVGKLLPDGKVVVYSRDTTERREAEEKLRESEGLYRTLIEASTDGIAIFNQDGTYAFISSWYEKLFCYSAAELEGLLFTELIEPESLEYANEVFAELLTSGGTAHVVEIFARRKDGNVRTIEASARTLPDGRVVAFARDITERKEAEEKIRESEALYRTLIEATTDGITILDPDGVFTFVSPWYEKALGYSATELIGQSFTTIVAPEGLDYATKIFAEVLTSGATPPQVEILLRRKDGLVRVFEASARTLPDGRIVSFSRDITERKQAENKIRESETLYRTLIEASTDGIDILNPNGTFNYISPQFEQLTGYSAEELVGQTFEPVLPPRELERVNQIFAELIIPGAEPRLVETSIRRKDGTIRAIEASARLLPDGRLVTYNRDVTEAQKVDKAFRALVSGTASTTGDEFFRSLVEHLATALGVRHAFVAETVGDPATFVRTLAFYSNGKIIQNLEYALQGTPCENVITGNNCYYPKNVQALFPTDLDLVKLGAESYLGAPLVDTQGNILGHVAVLDNEPMQDDNRRQDILKIFAARAGAELERQRADAKLRAIVEGTASVTGDEFFRSLVKYLAQALGVRYAYITQRAIPPETRVSILADWQGDDFVPNTDYNIAYAPCEQVILGKEICFYPSGVQTAFPADEDLVEQDVESYYGLPLLDTAGDVLGHLVLMDDKPMSESVRDNPILKIFVSRAAVELQRKLADEKLRQLNEELEQRVEERTAESKRLATILEATSDFVGMSTAQGQLVYMNQAGRDMVGIAPEADIQHLNILDLVAPSSHALTVQEAIPALLNHGHWRGEFDLKHQISGQIIPVSDVAVTLKDANSQAEFFAAINRDMTKEKRAEAELQRRAEQLATLNRIGFALTSGSLELNYILRELYEQCQQVAPVHTFYVALYDKTTDRIEFPIFMDREEKTIIPAHKLGDKPGLTSHVIQTRQTCHIPDLLKEKNIPFIQTNSELDRSYIGIPLISRDQVIGVMSIQYADPGAYDTNVVALMETIALQAATAIENARLFTETQYAKEIAETALAESRRLAAIIESMPDYVGIADLHGNSLYVNRAGRHLMGKPENDTETWNVIQCYPSEDREKLQPMLNAMQHGQSWTGELDLRHLSGSRIPTDHVVFPLHNGDGQIESYAAVIRDITERKRAEEEIHRAKEVAEAANKAKSTFLANMSHEIRTPMNAVIGMTGLLLNTPLNEKQRDFVETIRNSGDTLLTVINDILDFSKIEAGKLDLESQPFDLRSCIESALDLLAPQAAEKGLDIAYEMDDNVPGAIIGDVTRLRQIIVNLIGNGIKFTERGEVVVNVKTETKKMKDGNYPTSHILHISVKDTGIGISHAKLEKLFQSFSQLDSSTTREYGGTGLGLAISKRLAELMGGMMWAESDGSGKGSTFHFTIQAQATPAHIRTHLRSRQPLLAGKRILIVDDNRTNRRILTLQTQTWGMEPVEAASPSEALEIIKQGPLFDLAILDMHMPEMDGAALATEICDVHEQQGHHFPLILLTSLGYETRPELEEVYCFSAYLTKPVKPSQLYDVLVSVLVDEEREARRAQTLEPITETKLPRLSEKLAIRILLAEDVAVNQKFALLALDEMGYTADVAANGLEVLEALKRQPYDVILMDVQMPELDGLDATRRIRKEFPADSQPHIIAMTANAMQGDREMCIQAGMDDYISKPVYLEELQAALERAGKWLEDKRRKEMNPALNITEIPILDRVTFDKILRYPVSGDLITSYLEEANALVRSLEQAVDHRDSHLIREGAHSLKGSSSYIGAHRVRTLSNKLEQAGKLGILTDTPELFAQLLEAYKQTREVLQKENIL